MLRAVGQHPAAMADQGRQSGRCAARASCKPAPDDPLTRGMGGSKLFLCLRQVPYYKVGWFYSCACRLRRGCHWSSGTLLHLDMYTSSCSQLHCMRAARAFRPCVSRKLRPSYFFIVCVNTCAVWNGSVRGRDGARRRLHISAAFRHLHATALHCQACILSSPSFNA